MKGMLDEDEEGSRDLESLRGMVGVEETSWSSCVVLLCRYGGRVLAVGGA